MVVREYIVKLDKLFEDAAKDAMLSGNMDLYEMAD